MYEQRRLGGRYRLENELGRGGMAVVWRAYDDVLSRPVAVKVLAGRYAGDHRSRARILREARAAATLSHPNIAQVYDFGESEQDGSPYVVMELINGPTLQQRVSSGPLPPRTVFRICGEVAAALAVAHADGLVHRDIKLANIMVPPSGAKVVDFGIAAVTGPVSPEDALLGTPAYLAPERLTGGAVEPASDVYALGVLLYRLLAGRTPWSVESTTQMLDAHIHQEPAPLPPLPGVPDRIADLIRRCLAKDPAARPGAAEVSGTLGDAAEAVAADPVHGPAPGPPLPVSAAPGAAEPTGGSGSGVDRRGAAEPAGGSGSGVDRRAGAGRSGAVVGGAGAVPKRAKRAKLLVGAGLAGLAAAAPLLWSALSRGPGGEPRVAASPPGTPPGPTVTVSAAPGVVRLPGATVRVTVRQSAGSVSAGPATSVPAPGSVPPSRPPEPSPSAGSPSGSAPPEGTRLTSPGGSVLARCVSGRAELLAEEPRPEFSAEQVSRGPALAAAVLFVGERSRYRMTVTCVAGRPSAVVLPL